MKIKQGLLALLLFAAATSFAQAQVPDTALRLVLGEFKVHNAEVYKKNFATYRMFAKTHGMYQEWFRAAYTSETGRMYSIVIFKGLDQLTKYMLNRNAVSDKWKQQYPKLDSQNMTNNSGPLVRSYWRIRDSISYTEQGYSPEKYGFRKFILYSVVSGKEQEYEALAKEMMQVEASLGLKYNSIIYRCTDGYPNNYYLRFLPDDSRGEYYQHLDARDKTREGNAKLAELRGKMAELVTIIRIDHLNAVR